MVSEEGGLSLRNGTDTPVPRRGAREIVVKGFQPGTVSKIKAGEYYRGGGVSPTPERRGRRSGEAFTSTPRPRDPA